ncbi:MAG: DUF285 domain-containing protein [archaeon]|nr:DUF285 domain-containing protein [archaeon]
MGACNAQKKPHGAEDIKDGVNPAKLPADRDPNAPSFIEAEYHVAKEDEYITVSRKTWPADNRLKIFSDFKNLSVKEKNLINASTSKMFINDAEVKFTNVLPGEGNFKVKIVINPGVKITSLCKLFFQCSSLVKIDFTNFDASHLISMESMLEYCINLNSANLAGTSGFNTSKVERMNFVLCFCINLKEINFTNFSTRKATDFTQMFFYCQNLEKLDLSSFNLCPVGKNGPICVDHMFEGCTKLTKICDENNPPVCGAEKYEDVFKGCDALPDVVKEFFIPKER